MKAELIVDKTLCWFERMMDSPWCDRVCLTVIVVEAFYLGIGVIVNFLR